jgi:hypothetical protein
VIDSQPSGALLVRERDGAVLGPTPFHESWRPSRGLEKLRLEHDGFRPETVQVPLDRGFNGTIALKKDQPARPHHKPAHTPSKWENAPRPASPEKWDDPAKKEPVPI